MTLVAKVDGVALPDGALLIGGTTSAVPAGIQGLPTAAYFGEALFGGLSIDDPDGDYDFDGLHTLTVDETADTDRPRIWNGLLTGRRVHRGPYKSGPSRVWDVDIWEMNLLFALMVFRSSSAKRPAESDLDRAQYIMESAPMAFTPSVDNGRANYTDNPINFDESDLVTRYPIEALNEFAGIAGKNFYNYWDHDLEENSFHYDLIGVGPAASVTITNDEADTLDSTTFRPFLDAELDEGAEWTVTGMLLAYKGAYAYGIRQATIDSLSPTIFSPSEFQRDEVYRTDRVGRAATATSLINTMLADRATDRATIRCSIRVPAAVVNEGIEAGDLVTFKATHLTGYETETDIPIIRRNVVPTEGRVDMYDVHLELSGVGKPTGPGGGEPGPFPQQEPCDTASIGIVRAVYGSSTEAPPGLYTTGTLSGTPTPGHMLVCAWMSHTNALVTTGTMPSGWVQQAAGHVVAVGGQAKWVSIWTKIAEASEPTSTSIDLTTGLSGQGLQYKFQEWSGVDTVDGTPPSYEGLTSGTGSPAWEDHESPSYATVSITPTAGSLGVIVAAFAFDGPHKGTEIGGITIDSETGGSPPTWSIGHLIVEEASGAYSVGFTPSSGFHRGTAVAIMLTCSGANSCPASGVWKRNEFIADGDGNTTNFFTVCPYSTGSLIVKVDGVPVVTGLTEVDNTTGEFSLDFAPKAAVGDSRAERVTADYQGI